MKIVFICGCLEPGCDGVGDYIRRLAIALQQQGHEAASIALNDKFVTQDILTTQSLSNEALTVLRLPATWPIKERIDLAQHWLAEFNPEWLSLQFVPFAFHPKGLTFGLSKQLVRLGRGRLWHLMVHELWVGMEREAPAKNKWWGRIQRLLIKSLLLRLQPEIIHTQTQLYQAQLLKLGFSSHHLPLFANIPNERAIEASFSIPRQLSVVEKSKTISLVIFGGIHPGAPIEQFAREAALYAQDNAVAVTLTMIGRCGAEQEHWATIWTKAGLSLEILGEQAPNRISEVLLKASLGITTTPAALIEKSGTAAAMQEHGLPVLCVTRAWSPRGIKGLETPAGISVYQEGSFGDYVATRINIPSSAKVSAIAQQLSSQLSTTFQ